MSFWNALIEQLRAQGVAVETCSEISEGRYRNIGTLSRLASQLRVWLWFPLRLLWATRVRSRVQGLIVLVPTSPPYLPCIAALAARGRRRRVIHLVYDLYPDVLELGTTRRRPSAARWLLGKCTSIALARSDANVFLGSRLADFAQARYGSAIRPRVIPVGGDGSEFPEVSADSRQRVTALYAGNMGRGHEWATIAASIKSGIPPRIALLFHASGIEYRALKRAVAPTLPSDHVRFEGPLGHDDWLMAMRDAELSLITLKPGAGQVMLPSKLYSAMLAGQAILAICERDTDLADTVLKADAGWVVEPGDVAGLLAVLSAAECDRTLLAAKRANAQRYAREHFDMKVISRRWLKLLAEVALSDEPAVMAGRDVG